MTANFYLLSLRDVDRSPAYCGVVEFEDTVAECLDAKFLTPENMERLFIENPKNNKQILLVPAMTVSQVVQLLNSIGSRINKFDAVYAYIFEPILYGTELHKPEWRKSISNFFRNVRKLDHIFVPMAHAVDEFEETFKVSASFIPFACNVLRFGGIESPKAIDVVGYGRQDGTVSKLLSEALNQPDNNMVYYHTDNMAISHINDNYAYRRLFWKILRKSKIALAFDPFAPGFNKKFRFSFIALRWFESIAAGCVVVGKRPKCPEMEKLFSWENSTIELPDNPSEAIPFILNLLSDENSLAEISQRNYINARSHHDWRYRLFDILKTMGAEPPTTLLNQIELLGERKDALPAKSIHLSSSQSTFI